nr:carboxypeptidase-like regulatory domain-containing protein [uncultured Pseudomonas sp.]
MKNHPGLKFSITWKFMIFSLLAVVATTSSAQSFKDYSITRSNLGAWMLRVNPAQPGLNCAIRFIPVKRDSSQLAIFGPTASNPHSTVLFSGPSVPRRSSPDAVDLKLSQRDVLETTSLKGQLLPPSEGAPGGHVAVQVADVGQLLSSMRDSEKEMTLWMGGDFIGNREIIYQLDYDGLDKAKKEMLNCIAGREISGLTLDEALAEVRPLGNSTIAGSAFYKGGLLAQKQYPPKGSSAVSLIWMNDEFKAWYEQIKRDKKMPDTMPEHIAKNFMSTVITDDKGGFKFTRLPAGEYMLLASFSYEQEVMRSESIGQTHVFAGNQHIGTQEHMSYWWEIVKEPTTFQKTVVIKNDGDTLDVALDKSLTMCFFVCF